MGYSNFNNIAQVSNKFKLDNRLENLFPKVKSVQPTNWLKQTLSLAYENPLTKEKAKSERVISPILTEIAHWYQDRICLFSGEDLTVNPADDLNGPCDFFFSLHPPKLTLDAPIATLVEAKNEDMEWGIAQCAAQMYGAFLFNQAKKKPLDFVFGCACTDKEWRFMKLENNVFYIDRQSITDLPKILGAWKMVFELYGLKK